jgi:hypothetical protein
MVIEKLRDLSILTSEEQERLMIHLMVSPHNDAERFALIAHIRAMLIKIEGQEEQSSKLQENNRAVRAQIAQITEPSTDRLPTIHDLHERYDNLVQMYRPPKLEIKSKIKSRRSKSDAISDREPRPFKRLTFDESRITSLRRTPPSPTVIVTTPTPPSNVFQNLVDDVLRNSSLPVKKAASPRVLRRSEPMYIF